MHTHVERAPQLDEVSVVVDDDDCKAVAMEVSQQLDSNRKLKHCSDDETVGATATDISSQPSSRSLCSSLDDSSAESPFTSVNTEDAVHPSDSASNASVEGKVLSGEIHHSEQSFVESMMEDQLVSMFRMESSYVPVPISKDVRRWASGIPPEDADSLEDEEEEDEWRIKICEWCYRVVDHFKYDRDVVCVAMNFFDRYLGITVSKAVAASAQRNGPIPVVNELVDSRAYQLAAMTCLYLAIKLHAETGSVDEADGIVDTNACEEYGEHQHDKEKKRLKQSQKAVLRIESFAELSRGQFEARHILKMERKVLEVLRWQVNPPTPALFVSYFLNLFPKSLVPNVEEHVEKDQTLWSRSSMLRYESTMKGTMGPLCRHPQSRVQGSQQEHKPVRGVTVCQQELVLHVLSELSRYLSELSICLPPSPGCDERGEITACTTPRPSAVALASIDIAMDMLTEQALPSKVRDEFHNMTRRLSIASIFEEMKEDEESEVSMMRSLAINEARLGKVQMGKSRIPLCSEREDVRKLRRRITAAFVPDVLLQGCQSSNRDGGKQHPITIALDANLLNLDAPCQQLSREVELSQRVAAEGSAGTRVKKTETCNGQTRSRRRQPVKSVLTKGRSRGVEKGILANKNKANSTVSKRVGKTSPVSVRVLQ